MHNGRNYNNHFNIKELAEEFGGEFECLGINTEKYIIFSVSIKTRNKKTIDKTRGKDINKTIPYTIKLIDNANFMRDLLLNLVDNLAEGLH